MEMSEIKTGAKVAYLGACFVIGKIIEDKVLIYPARRSWTSGLPNRATVSPADITIWEPKAKVSPHAKTCQICGRPIHAAVGVIAHHGYERPGHGIQTDSCYGARFQAFEVNRDRLGWYIEEIAKPHLRDKQAARKHLDKPGVKVFGPEDIAYEEMRKDAWGKARKEWAYKHRIIGPDYDRRPLVWKDGIRGGERVLSDKSWELDRRTYDDYLSLAKANADSQVKWAEQHLNDQQKRYDNWKPA